jgi:PAS domain S-box-containing protein
MINVATDTIETPIYTVAKCLNEIIVNENLHDALQNIVEWLAEGLEINRCYILESNKSNPQQSIFTSPRNKAGTQLSTSNNILLNATSFPEIHNVLANNRTFKASINNQVSENLYQFLSESKLKSILLIPVFSGNKFWGSIGFGDSLNNRTWRNSENELQSLAAAIGSAIESNRVKKEIQQNNEELNATLSTVKEITWELDLVKETIQVFGSQVFLNALGASSGKFESVNWFNKSLHPEDRERAINKYQQFLQNDNNSLDEDVYRMYNHHLRKYCWMHSRRRLWRNAEGEAVLISGSTVDITDTKEVTQELSKQREQYEFLVQSLGQVIFKLDTDGKYSFLSNAWKELLGYKADDSFGRAFIEYLSPEHISRFWIKFGSLLAGLQKSFDEQMQLINEHGEKVWVRVLAQSTTNFDNRVTGVFGTIENIHNKYNAELLLHESNEKVNTILNSSKEIILTINLEKNIIENVNEAISLLGYKPTEWMGTNYKLWEDEQRIKFHELMKLAVQSELQVKNQQISFPHKTKNESIPFEFSTSIFYFKNTKYLLCVLRDIRERLKYEESITRISNQLTHLINNIDDVYAIYDLNKGVYDFISNNIEGLYGYKKDAFSSDNSLWEQLVCKEDRAGVVKEVEDIITRKGRGELFYRINTTSGERKMILEKLVVGKDKEGNANKLYIVKTDYTHIENAEQSLLETERKFRFIAENISDFISIHDPDWNFTYASPSIKNILGYEPEEILGAGGFDLVHPEDLLKTLDEALEPVVLEKKETQLRYRMRAKDGTYKWVESYSKPVIDSKGETSSIISSTRDVTDQVIAEQKLKDSEEQYRLLSENSNDVIAIYNVNAEVIYISPSCRQVLGFEPEELLGKKAGELISANEEGFVAHQQKIQEMLSSKSTDKFIQRIVTKSGEEKMLEVWAKPIFKGNELVAMQAASRDVTEREKLLVELEQSLEKERELNELRSMFVSTASHQFRTPLTVIQSGIELMEMYIEDLPSAKQEKFHRQFNKIESEVDRLQYLMSDILLLGRANAARTPFHPETGDIVSFCKDIAENKYNNRYNEDRKTVLSVSGEKVPVDFDPKLLGHAIENIISNAYKYSAQGNLFLQLFFRQNEVKIDITDQGIGIPEEDLKNLFQPFYRAANTCEIEGTGLGLAIVREFIEKHGGKIIVTSKLNKGTTVSVILPVKQNLS